MRYTPLFLLLSTATAAVINPNQRPLSDAKAPAMSATEATSGDTVTLSDVLGKDRSINIFAGFTRDFSAITQRFEDNKTNTTILAPINSAVMGLPRKPWENPEDYEKLGANAYEGGEGEERAKENMRRFVEAHVVPVSPWKQGEKVKTLGGGEVHWETKDGVKFIQPGNIEVSIIASKVGNGEVWILKKVINFAA